MCLDKVNISSNVANYRSDTCVAAIKIAREKEDVAFLKPLCGRRKESFGIALTAPAQPCMRSPWPRTIRRP